MMMPEAIHSSLNTKPFITTMSTPSSKFLSIPSFPIQPHPQIITTSPPQIPPFKPTQSPSISKMTPRIAAHPSSFHLLSHLHTPHIFLSHNNITLPQHHHQLNRFRFPFSQGRAHSNTPSFIPTSWDPTPQTPFSSGIPFEARLFQTKSRFEMVRRFLSYSHPLAKARKTRRFLVER